MYNYIGNDLEDRLKILETENSSLKKDNEYHQIVHEIDHMSDLHVGSSFIKATSVIFLCLNFNVFHVIGAYKGTSLSDEEMFYIHEYLIRK